MNQTEHDLKDEDPKEMKSVAFSPLATGLSMVGITTGYIFGPLILFGGIGWYLSEKFNNRLILFGALFVSFMVGNILIFKMTPAVLKKLNLRK